MTTPLLEPIDQSAWNSVTARHLLNRAGFGVDHDRAAKLAAMTPTAAVSHLVDYESFRNNAPEPAFIIAPPDPAEVRRELAALTEEERRKRANEYQQEERQAVQQLKGWWLERMLNTERPLEEKMTLFWHGHFATSAQKVRSSHHTYHLNKVFRSHATGNFKQLTIDVGQSPSMLHYLDNARSSKKSPNENWARELMELFTLGQGQYTEDDIKNSARAFTGWSTDHEKFVYRLDLHDDGEKVFMGRRGKLDGWDIINIIFEQPAASRFISAKLWTFFAYEDPEPDIVEGLAATLRQSNYNLKPMLRQLFASRAFYGDKAMGTQVKSPAQWVVQLVSDLRYDNPPYSAMARATQELGQDLFYPPNVKGWDGNRAWVNANTMLLRFNIPGMIISAKHRPEDRSMNYMGQAAMDSLAMRAEQTEMTMQQPNPPDGGVDPDRWDAREFFLSLGFRTPNECVDKLARHFLCVPLSGDQREVLLQALEAPGGPDAPMTRKNVNPRNIAAVMHLLLSTPEYQLC